MNGARVREGTEHIGSRGKRRIARPISSNRIEHAARARRKSRWAREGRSVATHMKFMRAAKKGKQGCTDEKGREKGEARREEADSEHQQAESPQVGSYMG